MADETPKSGNFIRSIIKEDLGKNNGKVITRFPPEPNGYLHIGHAKSICLNFGMAKEFGGVCNLRMDDTNPEKEEEEYIRSIQEDVCWLGFDWENRLFYASDYYDQLYEYALDLIKAGKAYVCDLSAEELRQYRGNLTEPGKESPYRNRGIEENLDLFTRMKNGEFKEGSRSLRAKIDMASPNLNMRDPTLYRIKKISHPRTKDKWCIYPMYDFAHGQSDALEGITHSLCTMEFQDHRPLYEWFLENLNVPCKPQQIEFARLDLNFTVMSKRRLKELVDFKLVNGWNDPRMPSLSGIRRRGYTPAAIRNFCDMIGISKNETTIDMTILEDAVRNDLNQHAPRAMCVLSPLKVVIENYPENQELLLEVPNHPQEESFGKRKIPFSRVIYIEKEDFMENPPKKFFRLSPGTEVRLRYAYIIKCNQVIKNQDTGEIVELRCSYDPETLGKNPEDRKVKGIIHWVCAKQGKKMEVRLYDRLFTVANPINNKEKRDFKEFLNPHSLQVLRNCMAEPSLLEAKVGHYFQFERQGYFCVDSEDSKEKQPVFNRTVTLRDTWAKISKEK